MSANKPLINTYISSMLNIQLINFWKINRHPSHNNSAVMNEIRNLEQNETESESLLKVLFKNIQLKQKFFDTSSSASRRYTPKERYGNRTGSLLPRIEVPIYTRLNSKRLSLQESVAQKRQWVTAVENRREKINSSLTEHGDLSSIRVAQQNHNNKTPKLWP